MNKNDKTTSKNYIKISEDDIDFIRISIKMLKGTIDDAADDFVAIKKTINEIKDNISTINNFKMWLLKKIFNIDIEKIKGRIEKIEDTSIKGLVKTSALYEILMWGVRDKLEEAVKKGSEGKEINQKDNGQNEN